MPAIDRRTVTTQGTGTAGAVPDAVTVVLTVEVPGSTPAEALRGCGTAQTAVLSALGVPAAASGVSVQPSWDNEHQRPGPPHAIATVTARLPDLASAGDVVTAALEAGGNVVRLERLTPVITDGAAARQSAREAAFQEARSSAEQYARLAGGRLGGLVEVTEGAAGGAIGGGWVTAARAPHDFAVTDGAQDVCVSLEAVWELVSD